MIKIHVDLFLVYSVVHHAIDDIVVTPRKVTLKINKYRRQKKKENGKIRQKTVHYFFSRKLLITRALNIVIYSNMYLIICMK